MSSAQALLAELASLGVSIALEGTKLSLQPRSALTESLISRVVAAKTDLVALLRARAEQAAAPALPPLEWWVLWAVAQMPHLSRAGLYASLPAPHAAVDQAVGALIARHELRPRGDGGFGLNVC